MNFKDRFTKKNEYKYISKMGNNPVFNLNWETPMAPSAHHIHAILSHQPELGPLPLLMRHTARSV